MKLLKIMDFRFSDGINVRLIMDASIACSSSLSLGHRHSYYELHFMEQGTCQLSLCGDTKNLGPDHYCLVPPYTYHYVLNASTDCVHQCIGFELQESGAKLNETEQAILAVAKSGEILSGISPQIAGDMRRLFGLLLKKEKSFVALEQIRALLTMVVLELFHRVIPDCPCDTSLNCSVDLSRKYLIEDYLSTTLDQHGGSAFLAKRLGVSERQMNRLFHTLYGKSYQERKRELRLETALDLLKNTDWPMEKIAAFIGYENASSFFYFIKRYAGQTPGALRTRVMETDPEESEPK